MDLGWKVMLPTSLAAVVVTAATVLGLDSFGVRPSYLAYGFLPVYGLVLAVVNVAMLALVIGILDRGRTMGGSGVMEEKRTHARELARRRNAQRGARVPVGTAAQP
jgi:NADH-quinone oxidoreductase subunit H